ncbi:MAG TPA: DmsE family decaheme c-type cytochrome [Azospira sp.]|nr:DmsE family decaheme c-type cytochrome [Azospira sp.]
MKTLRHLLAAAGIAAFIFGGIAHAAEPKAAPKDIVLKGDAKCTQCHDEADAPEVLRIGKTRHGTTADNRTPNCTSCHGESKAHADHKGSDKPPKPDTNFGKNTKNSADERSKQCLTCHQGSKHIFWSTSTHATNDVACSNCHKIHDGHDKVRDKRDQAQVCYTCHKQQRAEMSRPNRHPVAEGKMSCSDCHSAHGSPGVKQLARGTVNETCYTCHMEKRGPFINNHQPVTEDCGICHNPHGTTSPNLLKSRPPFLCLECHEGSSHTSTSAPGGLPVATAANVGPTGRGQYGSVGRGCPQCHTNIHGSNSPLNNATSGDRLTR